MTDTQAKQTSIKSAQKMERQFCVAVYDVDIDGSVFHVCKHVRELDIDTLVKIIQQNWGFALSTVRDQDIARDEYCRRCVAPSVISIQHLNVPSTP